MKKLRFKKLWIVSDRAKSARAEILDSDEVVVTSLGVNRTGKSSFIKSLYAALGADPKKNNNDWAALDTKLLLSFTIDGVQFYSLRVGRNVAFFDAAKEVLSVHYGITKASKAWTQFLDCEIEFPGKNGLVSPFPAAFFMPFYIDQDTGLNDTWTSFKGLEAYRSWKDTLVEFHTGVRPKEYYFSKSKKDQAEEHKRKQLEERKHFEFAQDKLKALTLDSDLNFDAAAFEREIAEYLKKQNEFNELREKVRLEVRELQGQRNSLFQERLLAVSTLKELEADANYLSSIDTSEIICPTCNTVHETSFANTLKLLSDTEACRGYLASINDQVSDLSKKIEKKTTSIRDCESKIVEINRILGETRGKINLKKMLEHESRRIAGQNLENEKSKIDKVVAAIDTTIRAAETAMSKASSVDRKKEILKFYQSKLCEFCLELNLPSPPEKMLKKLRPVVEDTGSDLPRLILAYHYAILHTIAKFSSTVLAPIVFDTAQHQDQDKDNLNAMIKFAFEKRPADTQIIFGTVDLHDFEYAGRMIVSKDQRNLLSSESFSSVHAEIEPFFKQFLASSD